MLLFICATFFDC